LQSASGLRKRNRPAGCQGAKYLQICRTATGLFAERAIRPGGSRPGNGAESARRWFR
jgi:hypothetical protein